MLSLAHRDRQQERMDDANVDPTELERGLRFIRRVNRWLGYTRATLHHLKLMSQRWKRGQTIRIVDLATGSADIPRAILKWAERRGHDVRIVGVDRHAVTARVAAEGGGGARLSIVQADVFSLPFAPGEFDYALCAMFLHHLDEEQVVAVLRAMDRLATRGLIVADLLRHRRAYAWIKVLTLTAGPMLRHDAAVSVAQAFTQDEVLALRDRAGVGYLHYHRHFGHRFVLAGEKQA